MKKNKKYKDGGSLFLTMPFGGSVANSPVIPGQLPDYQMGSNVNSGVIQNNLRDIYHYYGSNFPYMAEGGDMEDESGATDSFYTNKLNGFIDKVRGTAQKNLENNLLKEAMREMRGDNETVEYGPEDMEMAQYGMSTGDQSQNTYDDSYINNFANAYSKTKSFTDSLQKFARMSRIIQPTTEYQKIKRKFDLGFTDRFKEDNPWVNDDGTYKNVTRASFQDGGTLIPMFQGDEDESTVDFWTPEELAYLKSLSHKDRMEILKKGEAGSKQHVQSVVAGNQPQAQTQPQVQPQSQHQTQSNGSALVTANNTSVNTASNNSTTTTTNPPATTTGVVGATGTTGATSTNPFEGYTWHTDANGNKYIVTAEGQLYSPYKGAASSDNVYTPQEYYTPYNTPAGNQTYSFSERNKLTPEFREAMRSGALNNPNPQVIGLPHIEYRKALFPKNRNKEIKSISWQYGKMYGDPWGESMDIEPGPANPNAPQASSTPPGQDMDRMFAQISDNEKKYFATEADKSKVDPATGIPDWRLQNLDNSAGDQYNTTQKVSDAWDRIKGMPANNTDAGKTLSTKEQVLKEYDKVPAPLKDIATDHLFNASSDPRIFTLAAAGAIDMKDSAKYKDDPKLLEDTWAKNIDLINQQYNDDPQAFTSSVSDYRKVLYSKARRDSSIDTESTNGMPGLQYNAWAGRTGNTQDYLDKTYFDPAMGYVPYAAPVVSGIPQPPVVNSGVGNGVVTSPQNGGAQLSSQSIPNNSVTSEDYSTEPNDNTGMGQNVRTLPSNTELMSRIQGMPDTGNPQGGGAGYGTIKERLMRNQQSGSVSPREIDAELRRYGFRDGGSLHKFMRRYDDGGPFSSNDDEPFPTVEEMMQNALNKQYENKIDLGVTDMFGKPMSFDLSTKGGRTNIGAKNLSGEPIITDQSKDVEGDGFRGIKNPFNVKEEYKNRKKRDPWKAIRNINLATGFFNLDETAGLKEQLKKSTQASEAFADVGNSWGQYHPLTGQYMGPKGKQPPVMNTGFAQYGGSLYDNLKQGDEMYLTQEQIDQLLKRGVKLSYLD